MQVVALPLSQMDAGGNRVPPFAGVRTKTGSRQSNGGLIRGDEADLWLRDNDPAYAARDRDLRRGVKRLPPEFRKPA